ncbi:hypothetical protein CMO89_00750 [Candidatus Woesearchaeota archaeon]|nr:hypothetical protein [Candidatus Woesearchaeota archaeon]|tara:strand:+ start:3552 stop:4070 length:519 start_codon:yes stop_codon:yes gene_type:complete
MNKDLKKYLIISGIALLFLLLFKKIIVISLLVISSFVISYIINAFGLKAIGLELVTLSAVITGKIYGPLMGFIIALVLITFHLIMSGYLDIYILWIIPSYALVGILAGLFSGFSITQLGIALTILLNFIYLFFTLMFAAGNLTKLLPYSLSNVIINIILFSTIAKPLVGFIS